MLYDPKWQEPEIKPADEPWREILVRAAVLIDRNGWIQNSYETLSGFCALGAIHHVTRSRSDSRHKFSQKDELEAIDHLILDNPRDGVAEYGVVSWNDRPERTKEQVITKLLMTANYVKSDPIVVDSNSWTG
jgi:hypothetical protein